MISAVLKVTATDHP